MDVPNILEIAALTRATPKGVTLQSVTFSVAPGSIHGLLGEDGSGRLTLIRILGGFYPAGSYDGQVLLDGQPIAFHTPRDAVRAGISIVPRKPGVFPSLSIAENVTVASWQLERHLIINQRAMEAQARAVLERWSIDLDPKLTARGLSAGQKRQLMIARALATDPRLVVLDEPFYDVTGGSALSQLLWLIRRLAERGITCLLVARRPADLFPIADRLTVLRDGEVAGSWERAAFDETTVIAAMLSRRPGTADLEGPDLDDSRDLFKPLREALGRWMRPWGEE